MIFPMKNPFPSTTYSVDFSTYTLWCPYFTRRRYALITDCIFSCMQLGLMTRGRILTEKKQRMRKAGSGLSQTQATSKSRSSFNIWLYCGGFTCSNTTLVLLVIQTIAHTLSKTILAADVHTHDSSKEWGQRKRKLELSRGAGDEQSDIHFV